MTLLPHVKDDTSHMTITGLHGTEMEGRKEFELGGRLATSDSSELYSMYHIRRVSYDARSLSIAWCPSYRIDNPSLLADNADPLCSRVQAESRSDWTILGTALVEDPSLCAEKSTTSAHLDQGSMRTSHVRDFRHSLPSPACLHEVSIVNQNKRHRRPIHLTPSRRQIDSSQPPKHVTDIRVPTLTVCKDLWVQQAALFGTKDDQDEAMAQPIEEWITDIPPVTRIWVIAAVGTSLLVVSR